MTVLEMTWRHATKIWWSMFWRIVVIVVAAGLALGPIIGLLLTSGNVEPETESLIYMAVQFPISMLATIWAIYMVFDKSFSTFRIVLVPLSSDDARDA